MTKVLALLAVIWAALLPPLFTDGACTREFDAEHDRVSADRALLGSAAQARLYWSQRSVPYLVMNAGQCQHARSDAKDRLARMQTDMAPYKSLPLRALGFTLHWAR